MAEKLQETAFLLTQLSKCLPKLSPKDRNTSSFENIAFRFQSGPLGTAQKSCNPTNNILPRNVLTAPF